MAFQNRRSLRSEVEAVNHIEVSRFGNGAPDTLLHPIVLVAMVVTIALMLFLPRRYVIVPFLLCTFLTPLAQVVVVAGVHLMVVRILILFGWIRMGLTKFSSEPKIISGGFNSIDWVFLLWALFRGVAGMLQFMETAAVVNQFGFFWDALGGYFLLRFMIQDEEGITRTIKTFSVVVCILGLFVLNERLRLQNIYGYLGGVSLIPDVREGLVRAKASFSHAILAGVFGATLVPFFLYLWKGGKSKVAAVMGLIGSSAMVFSAASSTAILAYIAAFLGASCWFLRRQMRPIRWALLLVLVTLHLIMKAPVWFLIAHIDLVSGNSSYHRAELIDTFLRHFSDWWLVGAKATGGWGFEMWDVINQFVAEGELGGIATLVCFILIISLSYRKLGMARKTVEGETSREWLVWLLGVALFSHIVSYFGITYFDQTKFSWYALLAMISVATSSILALKVPAEQPDDGGFVTSQFTTASPIPRKQTSDVFPYKHARPFKPRSSYAGKLDK
jgi:hypothetical protein